VLTGIDVSEQNTTKKVFSKKTGDMAEITVPVKVLQINVYENSGPIRGQAIRDFQDRLRASPLFSSRLDDVSVSQSVISSKGQDVVSYQIHCLFKSGT
jgi:hypothetical protein